MLDVATVPAYVLPPRATGPQPVPPSCPSEFSSAPAPVGSSAPTQGSPATAHGRKPTGRSKRPRRSCSPRRRGRFDRPVGYVPPRFFGFELHEDVERHSGNRLAWTDHKKPVRRSLRPNGSLGPESYQRRVRLSRPADV